MFTTQRPTAAGAVTAGILFTALTCLSAGYGADNLAAPTAPAAPAAIAPATPTEAAAQLPPPQSAELTEIVIHSTEPRFVMPTRRDRIGRIWAPVYINGKGPFRLVLDSGANHSGITEQVAVILGLPSDSSQQVMLRGVTGSAAVPTVRVNSFVVGDVQEGAERLPIVTDALGGAEGVLGTDGMQNRRIYIDFRHDLISITRSRSEHADAGYRVIPFETMRGNLVVVDATVGGIHTKAIIDTGGQVTIANTALRQALERRKSQLLGRAIHIEGVTTDIQDADEINTPPLRIGGVDEGVASVIEIRFRDISFGDMRIFEHWRLTDEPAMLVGMDALGLLDTLIIDYRRHELQIRMRPQ
ncbi:MAG TPA: retropepsin-like aspartic protease [Steroidobacteraceae bacterium]|nr:retropepsin-like aspartic protease [Steroidobacteraceae bacterium]